MKSKVISRDYIEYLYLESYDIDGEAYIFAEEFTLPEERYEERFRPYNIFELIGIGFTFLAILCTFVFGGVKVITSGKKNDKILTKRLREILGNDQIEVFKLSPKEPNAFCDGSKNLYYTAGLSKLMTKDEVIACLLHEFGHFEHKHVQKSKLMLFSSFTAFTTLLLLLSSQSKEKLPFMYWYIMFMVVLWGTAMAQIPYNITYGRTHELLADSYATKYGYKKEMISALKKLEKWVRKEVCKDMTKEKCDLTMHKLHKFDEHPEAKKRIEALLKKSPVPKLLKFGLLDKAVSLLRKMGQVFARKAIEGGS